MDVWLYGWNERGEMEIHYYGMKKTECDRGA